MMQQASSIVMGFDFGYKRIGVAIGNLLTQQARPLKTLPAKQGIPKWEAIRQLLNTWQPATLVVGLPTHLDGSTQYTTQAARQFAAALETHAKLPVVLVDERLTTVAARSALFEQGGYKQIRKSEIDCAAACIILEQWLHTTPPQA